MKNKITLGLTLLFSATLSAQSFALGARAPASGGDQSVEDANGDKNYDDGARRVVTVSSADLAKYKTNIAIVDKAIAIGASHVGTEYEWGGDSLTSGIDCSHFTRKVYQQAGSKYTSYMSTDELVDISNSNGLKKVDIKDAKTGDLLVYGYNDDSGWHGHVVVVVDMNYRDGNYDGLVLGSHGTVGIQFLTLKGFPNYYHYSYDKLRTVLRPQ